MARNCNLTPISSTRRFARFSVAAGLAALLLVIAPTALRAQNDPKNPPPAKPADKAKPVLTEDNEVKIGRENAEENDKHIQLVTDAALVERVNRIGSDIAAVANTIPIHAGYGSSQLKQFNYTFKIVNDKDVNAYSMPGGFIYVNKGLLDYVHSDDELAGVLAHEISHAAHHHMVKLMREQSKITNILIPVLAGILIGTHAPIQDFGTVLQAGELYVTAKTNTYGVEAEKDADHTGMMLMTHTKYNPAGLYSFMLRLAADEQKSRNLDLGIFRTHPPGVERAAAARALLEELEIPIELSKVDPNLAVSVTVVKATGPDPEMAILKTRGITLMRVVGEEGLTAEVRGKRIAAKLSELIDSGLQPFEIRVSKDQTKVVARTVIVMTDTDGDAFKKPLATLAKEFSDAIMLVSQRRQLDTPQY